MRDGTHGLWAASVTDTAASRVAAFLRGYEAAGLSERERDYLAERIGHLPAIFASYAAQGIVHPFRRREGHVYFQRGRVASNARIAQGRTAGSRIHRA